MNASNNSDSNQVNPPKDPKKGVNRGAVITSWCVIIFSAVVWINQESLVEWLMSHRSDEPNPEQVDSPEPSSQLAEFSTPELEMTAKLIVGFKGVLPEGLVKAVMSESVDELRTEDSVDRVAWSILQAVIGNDSEATDELNILIADNKDNKDFENELIRIRSAVTAKSSGEVLSDNDRKELIDSLGYFGEVAVSLSDASKQNELENQALPQLVMLSLAIGAYMMVGLIGLVVLIFMSIFALSGKITTRLKKISYSGVYAETFAIWIVLFFVLQVTVGILEIRPPVLMSSIAFFLSLLALVWPVIRGHSWSKVRKDIGWYGGRSVWFEPIAGLATWSMAIPFMVIGLIITQLLILIVKYLTGDVPVPGHPVQEMAGAAGGIDVLYLFIAVSLAAPIVEETMFRGVLYAHMRGISRRMSGLISVVTSMLVTSILFAAIHPRGLVFIPPLAGLAIGFCIGREWRGSLLASMFAHGYHNAMTITLTLILFS